MLQMLLKLYDFATYFPDKSIMLWSDGTLKTYYRKKNPSQYCVGLPGM